MADRTLSAIAGNQGDFVTRALGFGTINGGLSGSVLTLTPPTGQRVRVTYLSTNNGLTEAGVSLVFGTTTIISAASVGSGDTGTGWTDFSIGGNPINSTAQPPRQIRRFITGKVDEPFIVQSALTTNQMHYGYEYGE